MAKSSQGYLVYMSCNIIAINNPLASDDDDIVVGIAHCCCRRVMSMFKRFCGTYDNMLFALVPRRIYMLRMRKHGLSRFR